jgi:hypothetical protein
MLAMEVLNDGGEAIYEELDATEVDESIGMGANRSYGGIASTRAEEEVEEEVFSDEGFAMGANQSYGDMASPRTEEEEPSNEALNEDQGNSGDLTGGHEERNEERDRIKSSPSKMIYIVLFAILAVSVLSVACSIGFALELKSETASLRQDLEVSSVVPYCATLQPYAPSGYYWARTYSGSAVRVYCDMTLTWD